MELITLFEPSSNLEKLITILNEPRITKGFAYAFTNMILSACPVRIKRSATLVLINTQIINIPNVTPR